jgi:hypothetical protein
MAVAEQDQATESSEGGARNTALKAAAAAAATGAATFAVRKMLSHDGHGSDADDASEGNGSTREGSGGRRSKRGSGNTSSVLSSAVSSAWDAASHMVIPVAEDAADAAGKYLAEHGPDVVRERIVPRFIEAFNQAN